MRANSVLACLLVCLVGVDVGEAQKPQFNRDIRPILSENCFRCHGPDEAAREADMRLDKSDDATADRGGYRIIDPGKPETSELIRRIATADHGERMPPRDSGSTLGPEEIEILRQWITGGAEYQSHWSFIPLQRPSLPEVNDPGRAESAIDRFVLSRLHREGLQPSAEADPATLIRRVTLDLTGLPPTLDEIDAFERASIRDPQIAYSRLVDRLLASPRYGERMALGWLDAARYADTNGYFTDQDRTMWPWRDWVIDAFNQNMPFDQFTIEQLAGDLLPHSTIDQKIATGFNRNHMVNNETGIIEEEFRVEYVVDRVDTTSTVWMGLTIGCARCHDHKYDPISQKEFYQFFSLFNNVPEKGLSGSRGNAAPIMKVPTAEQQVRIEQIGRTVADAEKDFAAIKSELDAAQANWEKTAVERLPRAELDGLVNRYVLDEETASAAAAGPVTFVPGMLGNAVRFAGDACICIDHSINWDRHDAFSVAAWIQPAGAGCVISKTDDAADMRGFDVTLRKGKAIVNLVHRWNSDAIQVSTASQLPNRQWQHLMVTYDGSSQAAGVKIYLDGHPQSVEAAQDNLSGTIRNGQPLRIGRRQASASYSGLIDEVRLYDRQLNHDEVLRLATTQLVRGVVARPIDKRSDVQKKKLRNLFIHEHADHELASASDALEKLRKNEKKVVASVPTTMVMQESEKPRQAFVLVRGQYDQPGEEVASSVPEFISSRPTSNRLDLAKWLVEPSHPLTARVTVNRLWQQVFGRGIVKTVDDFGTQGDWPSHPGLLDQLAVDLIESGWDVKRLLRSMVMSATYRQSSNCSPHVFRRDRLNRFLARGPRFRMDAELLRDNALAMSGLLVEKNGGPSVMPYQPEGLWLDVTYDGDRGYLPGRGASLYRRSLYTFWKRQAPPPNMLVFDAPTRETCTVQRSRTNTPLQALALMNDPTFVEAARELAERMMMKTADGPSDRIVFAFRSATARRPTADESEILMKVYRQQKEAYERNSALAIELLSVGESSYEASLDVVDLAAWTTICSMILSLDETITKP